MTSCERTEMRAVIKFCHDLGKTPTQTLKMMEKTESTKKVSRALVFKWHKRFSEGRTTLKDDERQGRKRIVDVAARNKINDVVREDRRLTVRSVAEETGLSIGTVHSVLTNELEMKKVCARWVPRLLSSLEKERRVADSKFFLRQFRLHGETFLNRIITTDETWLWFFDPETKQQSAVWKRNGSPPPIKARVNKSGEKHMCIMFADRQGMLLNHIVPKGKTVNSEYYSKVIRRDLARALQKKRSSVRLEECILHQDNAPPHVSELTKRELAVIGLECLRHPPYSPDLAPMDFAIFPEIKRQLKGHRFYTLDELKRSTTEIIAGFPKGWYADIFDQWIKRHERCVNCNGDYFEKM